MSNVYESIQKLFLVQLTCLTQLLMKLHDFSNGKIIFSKLRRRLIMNQKIELKNLIQKYNSLECPSPEIKLSGIERNIEKQIQEKAILIPGPTSTLLVKGLEFEIQISHDLSSMLGIEAKGSIKTQNKVLVDLEMNENGVQSQSMTFNKSPVEVQIIQINSSDYFTYTPSDTSKEIILLNDTNKNSVELGFNNIDFLLRSQLKSNVPKVQIRHLIETQLENMKFVQGFIKEYTSIPNF